MWRWEAKVWGGEVICWKIGMWGGEKVGKWGGEVGYREVRQEYREVGSRGKVGEVRYGGGKWEGRGVERRARDQWLPRRLLVLLWS